MMNAEELNILLIDDDSDDSELFLIAMEDTKINAKCMTFSGCAEALLYLHTAETLPDFIFLDLNMPKMDGRECLCELKKALKIKDIPVVIFSTSTETKDKDETAALGAVDFIGKPSKVSELSAILDRFFTKHLRTKQQ
ncbi:MAG: response regulator [Bacteroidia bacterium]